MIAISRSTVIVIVAVMALVGIPLALIRPEQALVNVATALPLILLLELAIYGVLTLVANPRMSILRVLGIAISLMVFRAVCSLLASAIAAGIQPVDPVGPLDCWVGSPIAVLLQVVTVILVAGHLVAFIDPSALDSETVARLGVDGSPTSAPRPIRGEMRSSEAVPTGGFIQVFSYEELSAMLRKTPGLEGFLVYTQEGLIAWRDLPMRLELDALAARFKAMEVASSGMMDENRLGRQRRLVFQTREHTICVQDLNTNFGLILVYNGRVSLGEIDERIEQIGKTTREFLQWKYPGLTLIVPSASKVAVEML